METKLQKPSGFSEKIRISADLKKRIQAHCHQYNLPLQEVVDRAVYEYVRERMEQE